ncbi:MAG: hypothetical protein JW724_02040 [Candidatus Altiarchaeota archaeon]|nr:hypothetical protein [Candidatus Altiarchaeota archaeon]
MFVMNEDSRKRHPMSDIDAEKIDPIRGMNQEINKFDTRTPRTGSFRMSQEEREGMMRILESAAKFKPYNNRKKGP